MANKKATIYILNVSHSMSSYPDDMFSKASHTILSALEDRCLAGKKTDLATVLLCGTPETDNILATPGQYEHVQSLTEELTIPNADLLRTFSNVTTSKETDTPGDALDALIVAVQMIANVCKKHLKYTKAITIFTDGQNEIDWLDIDYVVDSLRDNQIELTIVGADHDELKSPDCSDIVRTNYEKWEELIQKGYQGQIISVKKAYEISQECFAPEVNARPSFGGYLYLGNPYINDHWLAISIDMYLRTKDAKLPTNHKYSALSEVGTHNVAAVSKYALDIRDEESDETKEIEIPKEELRKGYKFGKSMLIVNEEVSNAMKLQTKKEMTIIGFVDAEEFPRHYLYSNALVLTAGKKRTDESAKALTALAQALYQEKCYALVRYVSKDGGQPKMGILAYEFDENGDNIFVLQYFEIPFADDVRDYKFRSVKKAKTVDQKGLDAMENLVDAMNLDELGVDYLAPESNYNPIIWRMNTAIKTRALNPTSAIPEIDDRFRPQIEIADVFKEQIGDIGEELAKYFDVKKVHDKGKKRAYGQMDVEPSQNGEATPMEDILGTAASDARKHPNMDTDLIPLIQNKIKSIGLVTPVDDFNAMINSTDEEEDMVAKAVQQMHDVIKTLLDKSFGMQHFKKVHDCIKAFRDTAAEQDEASSYNRTIKEVKAWCNLSDPNQEENIRREMWKLIKASNLSLITRDECEDYDTRDVTKEDAEKFWIECEEVKPVEIQDNDEKFDENYEDLF